MAELIMGEIKIKGTANELVQIMAGLEKAQQLAKNEPVNKPIVGRLAVILNADAGNCLLGFKKGDVVRIIEHHVGSSLPFKVRNEGLYSITGWARRDEISFVEVN